MLMAMVVGVVKAVDADILADHSLRNMSLTFHLHISKKKVREKEKEKERRTRCPVREKESAGEIVREGREIE